jgi:hypothetical protein
MQKRVVSGLGSGVSKAKRLGSICTIALLVSLCGSASAYSGGSGTTADPYQIATKTDLLQLAATPADYGKGFVMVADVNLANEPFDGAVIARDANNTNDSFEGTPFSGVFDGAGHSVLNMRIDTGTAGGDYLGLFGYTSSTATIKSVTLSNATIIGTSNSFYCGCIVGYNGGAILNCSSSGAISAGGRVGGIAGKSGSGNVSWCHSTADVTATSWGVGGLIGNTYATSITECYADGNANSPQDVGGLVGNANTGTTIQRCYATGDVSGSYAGGLVGIGDPCVVDSFARGNLISPGTNLRGGLFGWMQGGWIQRCYSTGHVTGSLNTGGLVGSYWGMTLASFWDTQTSGTTTSAGGTGKTTAQMMTQSTFTAAGWDFVGETANGTNDYWLMTGGSYPTLTFAVGGNGTAVSKPALAPSAGSYFSPQSVMVICLTPGAEIHYTTSGVDPTESDPTITSGTSFYVDRTMTLKAKAWKTGLAASSVASAAYSFYVSAPVLSPMGGFYTSNQTVTVTCSTPDAVMHYTTNGNEPTESDPVVASGGSLSVSVYPPTTLKVKAFRAVWGGSTTTMSTYRGAIHVAGDGNDTYDGSDWAHAKRTLQGALDIAADDDEIWVAAGTYYPTSDYGLVADANYSEVQARLKHFRMKDGVGIYGGFTGTETTREQRDFRTNVTILSGDIGILGDVTDNCYHVIYLPATLGLTASSVLDGFTVTGGNANSYTNSSGGGLCQASGNTVTIGNCTFQRNRASMGAGLTGDAGVTATNCMFLGNVATYDSQSGGGAQSSNGTFINCVFAGNAGGGLRFTTPYMSDGTGTLWNCTIAGNSGTTVFNYGWFSWTPPTNSIIADANVMNWPNPDSPDIPGSESLSASVMLSQPTSGNFVRYPNAGLDGVWGTLDDDYGDLRLTAGSRYIDAGNNGYVNTTTDIAGNLRIFDGDGNGTATVDMGAYEYLPAVAMPVLTPGGGGYAEPLDVVVTCATSGATLHYTTDGTEPDQADSVIISGGSIHVEHRMTIKVKAWKSGLDVSPTATGTYYIATGRYSGGSGVPGDPYQISSVDDLMLLAGMTSDYGSSFILTQDLDLGATTYQTALIAPDTYNLNTSFEGTAFTGSFDGDGHTISNLYIYANTDNDYLGLFGYIGSGGVVRNVHIANCSVSYSAGTSYYTGAVAGSNYGTIEDCSSSGLVHGLIYTGGIAGRNVGTISRCGTTADVKANNSYCGGVIGRAISGSSLTQSYSLGDVNSTSGYAGGVVGDCLTSSSVSDCYARCRVHGSSYVGGAVGRISGGIVANSYSAGPVIGGSNTGGFVGAVSSGAAESCFWDMQTSGQSSSGGGYAMGLTTSEMMRHDYYYMYGWDLNDEPNNGTADIWRICHSGGVYPRLSWELPGADMACPGGVEFSDYAQVAGRWLQSGCTTSNQWCGWSDVNQDGIVDIRDVGVVASHWLEGR